MADVTCLGILVNDVVALPVDRYPEPGELMRLPRIEMHIGGCAANTGIDLQKIGIDTAVIGKVGNDGFGDFLIKAMAETGVDCAGVSRDNDCCTSVSMVMVRSDGERSFIHTVGANAHIDPDRDIDFDIIKKSKILHVAGSFLMPGFDGEPTAKVLAKAKEMGITTCLDTAGSPTPEWKDMLAPCYPYLDMVVPSYDEATVMTDKTDPKAIAEDFMNKGIKTVAIKMGSKGSYVCNGNEEYTLPIYKVKAIDANGCGDSFAAGFIAGVVNGWDLEMCGKFANAVGAFCVQGVGTTAGIKDQATILKFMEEYDAQ